MYLIGPILQALSTNIWLFIGARFLTGALGGSLTISYAYVADIFPPLDCPKYQSELGAAVSVAYVIGPLIGSVLVNIHINFPLYFSGGVTFIFLIFAIFLLKDPKQLKKTAINDVELKDIPPEVKIEVENNEKNMESNDEKDVVVDVKKDVDNENNLENNVQKDEKMLVNDENTKKKIEEVESRLSTISNRGINNDVVVYEENVRASKIKQLDKSKIEYKPQAIKYFIFVYVYLLIYLDNVNYYMFYINCRYYCI